MLRDELITRLRECSSAELSVACYQIFSGQPDWDEIDLQQVPESDVSRSIDAVWPLMGRFDRAKIDEEFIMGVANAIAEDSGGGWASDWISGKHAAARACCIVLLMASGDEDG